jgi:hypothetical protein
MKIVKDSLLRMRYIYISLRYYSQKLTNSFSPTYDAMNCIKDYFVVSPDWSFPSESPVHHAGLMSRTSKPGFFSLRDIIHLLVFITSIWIKQRNQYAFCVSKKNTL